MELTTLTFWFGYLPTERQQPAAAYHASLKGRTLEAEATRLLKRHAREVTRGGTHISRIPDLEPHCRPSNLKVWAKWDGSAAVFEIRQLHPADDALPGELVMRGMTPQCSRAFFLEWARKIRDWKFLTVTLLDDDLVPRIDKLYLLVEWFSFTIMPDLATGGADSAS